MNARAPLTYTLLLKLYHGRASVVELLSAADRGRLAVETSVFSFIQQLPARAAPRHVLLTGNAGDGKTFAVQTALPERSQGMFVVHDASAIWHRGVDPIRALADELEGALQRGERLCVAINRGQLERLLSAPNAEQVHPLLSALLRRAKAQLQLQPSWPSTADAEVAVVDLGIWDSLHESVLEALLERLSTATADVPLAAPAAAAFAAAQATLRDPGCRGRLIQALQATRALGLHTTMRQLWATLAFLVTGARAPDDARPLSLRDAVGARLFDEEGHGELHERLRQVFDPALTPQPALTLQALRGQLPPLIGLPPLAALPGEGRALLRATWLHGGAAAEEVKLPAWGSFERFVEHLRKRPPGWHHLPTVKELLRGAYRELGLWAASSSFPAWRRLCYDSTRADEAAVVALSDLSLDQFMLSLPRPSPGASSALGEAWRPAHLLLKGPGEVVLRLTPRMLEVLHVQRGSLNPTERALLRRWVATLEGGVPDGAARVYLRGQVTPIEVKEDELSGQLQIS